MIPPETDPARDKTFYLDLIKKQTQQMRELGFMGSPGAKALAETEAQLGELDISVLEAIARSAGNLLIKAAAIQSNPDSGHP